MIRLRPDQACPQCGQAFLLDSRGLTHTLVHQAVINARDGRPSEEENVPSSCKEEYLARQAGITRVSCVLFKVR